MASRQLEIDPQTELLHIASPLESWGWIALRYYADEGQMSRLIRANPLLAHVAFFDGGERVRVPIIAEEELADAEASTPPWRR